MQDYSQITLKMQSNMHARSIKLPSKHWKVIQALCNQATDHCKPSFIKTNYEEHTSYSKKSTCKLFQHLFDAYMTITCEDLKKK